MRLRITHQVGFELARQADSCFGEARIQPQWGVNQSILNSTVSIEPSGWRMDYIDYWGARVIAFSVFEPHERIQVTARTDLDFSPIMPPPNPPATWEQLHDGPLQDRLAEFLHADEDYQPSDEVVTLQRAAKQPRDFVRTLSAKLRQGQTTTLVDALRWAGVPTRVVSGYLLADALSVNIEAQAQPHSWLQTWDGAWRDWDPKMQVVPSSRHVAIAAARHLTDIPSLVAAHNADLSQADQGAAKPEADVASTGGAGGQVNQFQRVLVTRIA